MPVTVHKHLESSAMFLFYTRQKQAAEYLVPFDNELSKVAWANWWVSSQGTGLQQKVLFLAFPQSSFWPWPICLLHFFCAFPSFLLHEVQSNLPSQKRTGKFSPFKVLWNHMETTEHIVSTSMPGSFMLYSVFGESLFGAVLAGAAVLPFQSQMFPSWQCSLSGCYRYLCDKQAQEVLIQPNFCPFLTRLRTL